MRYFTYVDDIVQTVSRLIQKSSQLNPEWTRDNPYLSSSYASYKVYKVGNNSLVRLMEFIEAVENKLGNLAKKNYMDLQPRDVPETYANAKGLFKDIEFKSEIQLKMV